MQHPKSKPLAKVKSCFVFSSHEFHKHCVDPWLIEHRTCPMCKTNILKELGMVSINNMMIFDLQLYNYKLNHHPIIFSEKAFLIVKI